MGQHSCEKAIFDSWRNCARLGLCPDIACPTQFGTEEELAQLQKEFHLEIAALAGGVGVIGTEIPERTAFLLTESQGILLKKNPGRPFSTQSKGRDFPGGKLRRNQCGCPCPALESIV